VCCAPFHQGEAPQTALQLMRSRYSAYKLNMPDYIIATTHPDNSQYQKDTDSWKKSISHFSTMCSFDKLDILGFEEEGDRAFVTFTAHIRENGRDISFTEKSEFEKAAGRWLYLRGEFQKN
jgi:SEC-C motif-containing protein